MKHILDGIDTVSEWSGKVLSMWLIVIILVLLWELSMRYAFNAPTIWAHESCKFLFGSYSVLSGAYVLLHNRHIRIDILTAHLSPRPRAIVNSFTYLIFFLFIGAMLGYGAQMAWTAVGILETGEPPWKPPMYPIKICLVIGAFLMLLQGLANFIRTLNMAVMGRELG